MSDKKKERFRHGPESEQFNKFKGEFVYVAMLGTPVANKRVGKLVWVDVYTCGIQFDPDDKEPTIVYKGPGVCIGPAEPDNARWGNNDRS